MAAFLNSNGGNLLIGVSDDNEIIGLDRDLSFFNNNIDKLERNISEKLLNSLGVENKSFYEIHIDVDLKVCRITVDKCINSKTWAQIKNDKIFFIRDGNRTKALAPDEADAYWENRE